MQTRSAGFFPSVTLRSPTGATSREGLLGSVRKSSQLTVRTGWESGRAVVWEAPRGLQEGCWGVWARGWELSAGSARFDPHKPLTKPTLPYVHSGRTLSVTGVRCGRRERHGARGGDGGLKPTPHRVGASERGRRGAGCGLGPTPRAAAWGSSQCGWWPVRDRHPEA